MSNLVHTENGLIKIIKNGHCENSIIWKKLESRMGSYNEAFPQTTRRPGNSRVNTRKIEHTFDLTLHLWQTGVTRMLTEIFEKKL